MRGWAESSVRRRDEREQVSKRNDLGLGEKKKKMMAQDAGGCMADMDCEIEGFTIKLARGSASSYAGVRGLRTLYCDL